MTSEDRRTKGDEHGVPVVTRRTKDEERRASRRRAQHDAQNVLGLSRYEARRQVYGDTMREATARGTRRIAHRSSSSANEQGAELTGDDGS